MGIFASRLSLIYSIATLFSLAGFVCAEEAETMPMAVEFDWSADALSLGDLTEDLSTFYTVMHNSGQLRTTQIEINSEDSTITDAMRRAGVWPSWIEDSNLLMDALLCDLNEKCSRSKMPSSSVSLNETVDGFAPTSGRWTIRAGDTVTIPDYQLVSSYIAQVSPVTGSGAKPKNAIPNSNFDSMYCAALYGNCSPDVPTLSWDQESRPPVLFYEAEPSNTSSSLADPRIAQLKNYYSNPNSPFELVAVPTVRFAKDPQVSLTADGEALPNGTLFSDFKSGIGANALLPASVQFENLDDEKTEMMQSIDDAAERLMNFSLSQSDQSKLIDYPRRSLSIYHVDRQANFDNCFFAKFQNIQFKSWKESYSDGVDIPLIASQECKLSFANKVNEWEHGTHTLGLLARFLSTGLFDSDDPLISIHHFPVEYDAAGNITNADKLLAFMGEAAASAPLIPTVFSISMSWDENDLKPVSQKILDLTNIPFIVAAPRLENDDRCSRSPAALRVGNNPAKHVISVVAYDLLESEDVWQARRMDGAGYGDTCHDIGAIGVGVGPVGANKIGVGKGSSQATPIAAAAAAHIMSFSSEGISPENLAARLVSTGSFQSTLDTLALGGMLDFGNAITIDDDILHTTNGCKYIGKINAIRLDTGARASLSMKRLHHGSGSLPDVRARELLRLKRLTLDGELSNVRFWSVHEAVPSLFSSVVEISTRHQRHRRLIFNVFEAHGNFCKPTGVQEFSLSEVSDVINSKVGNN